MKRIRCGTRFLDVGIAEVCGDSVVKLHIGLGAPGVGSVHTYAEVVVGKEDGVDCERLAAFFKRLSEELKGE